MTIMAVPVTPVGSHRSAGDGTYGGTPAAAQGAPDDCAANSTLRECVRQRYRDNQSQ